MCSHCVLESKNACKCQSCSTDWSSCVFAVFQRWNETFVQTFKVLTMMEVFGLSCHCVFFVSSCQRNIGWTFHEHCVCFWGHMKPEFLKCPTIEGLWDWKRACCGSSAQWNCCLTKDFDVCQLFALDNNNVEAFVSIGLHHDPLTHSLCSSVNGTQLIGKASSKGSKVQVWKLISTSRNGIGRQMHIHLIASLVELGWQKWQNSPVVTGACQTCSRFWQCPLRSCQWLLARTPKPGSNKQKCKEERFSCHLVWFHCVLPQSLDGHALHSHSNKHKMSLSCLGSLTFQTMDCPVPPLLSQQACDDDKCVCHLVIFLQTLFCCQEKEERIVHARTLAMSLRDTTQNAQLLSILQCWLMCAFIMDSVSGHQSPTLVNHVAAVSESWIVLAKVHHMMWRQAVQSCESCDNWGHWVQLFFQMKW